MNIEIKEHKTGKPISGSYATTAVADDKRRWVLAEREQLEKAIKSKEKHERRKKEERDKKKKKREEKIQNLVFGEASPTTTLKHVTKKIAAANRAISKLHNKAISEIKSFTPIRWLSIKPVSIFSEKYVGGDATLCRNEIGIAVDCHANYETLNPQSLAGRCSVPDGLSEGGYGFEFNNLMTLSELLSNINTTDPNSFEGKKRGIFKSNPGQSVGKGHLLYAVLPETIGRGEYMVTPHKRVFPVVLHYKIAADGNSMEYRISIACSLLDLISPEKVKQLDTDDYWYGIPIMDGLTEVFEFELSAEPNQISSYIHRKAKTYARSALRETMISYVMPIESIEKILPHLQQLYFKPWTTEWIMCSLKGACPTRVHEDRIVTANMEKQATACYDAAEKIARKKKS